MRQLTRSFIETDFNIFPVKSFKNIFTAAMTRYVDDQRLNVAFPVPEIKNGLAECLSLQGKKQFHIAETEKYAHVTYFFNCLNNQPYNGETDLFIDSDKNHLENPAMKASEITDQVLEHIKNDQYDFYVINFASADVLAHLGNFEAATRGVEAVDRQIGRLYDAILTKDGMLAITADHGNAESLLYQLTGDRETKHNDNPVPFHVVGKRFEKSRPQQTPKEANGLLADVAPTILALMEMEKPAEMTGDSLLKQLT